MILHRSNVPLTSRLVWSPYILDQKLLTGESAWESFPMQIVWSRPMSLFQSLRQKNTLHVIIFTQRTATTSDVSGYILLDSIKMLYALHCFCAGWMKSLVYTKTLLTLARDSAEYAASHVGTELRTPWAGAWLNTRACSKAVGKKNNSLPPAGIETRAYIL